MASYSIEFAKSVRKDFKGIPKTDANKILEKVKELSENPRPPGSKKLTNDSSYRIRIGTYRVVYDIVDQRLLILILRVGHRKSIYKK